MRWLPSIFLIWKNIHQNVEWLCLDDGIRRDFYSSLFIFLFPTLIYNDYVLLLKSRGGGSYYFQIEVRSKCRKDFHVSGMFR